MKILIGNDKNFYMCKTFVASAVSDVFTLLFVRVIRLHRQSKRRAAETTLPG